ncbi:hypothetical protein B0H67DRAFT_247867 [Lasiosphaeris hirsuta]|uniref:Uncharacterized protein n=1 Tax=Lasiosphaeris hirsuta TaxID=260670 RepID=A0AA40AH57_9PEZI|nr:hypothetical protein B0H67DRAFT_247867 [Lasiosphaeris hirsuta]
MRFRRGMCVRDQQRYQVLPVPPLRYLLAPELDGTVCGFYGLDGMRTLTTSWLMQLGARQASIMKSQLVCPSEEKGRGALSREGGRQLRIRSTGSARPSLGKPHDNHTPSQTNPQTNPQQPTCCEALRNSHVVRSSADATFDRGGGIDRPLLSPVRPRTWPPLPHPLLHIMEAASFTDCLGGLDPTRLARTPCFSWQNFDRDAGHAVTAPRTAPSPLRRPPSTFC